VPELDGDRALASLPISSSTRTGKSACPTP